MFDLSLFYSHSVVVSQQACTDQFKPTELNEYRYHQLAGKWSIEKM
jgi:hypothetical protein